MTITPHQSGLITGTIRAEDDRGVIRMEGVYDTTHTDLWSALTEPDRLSRWIAEVRGDLRPAGRFHARFTSGWDGVGRVDVCEPHHHLVVTMNPGGGDETVIEATLADEGAKNVFRNDAAVRKPPRGTRRHPMPPPIHSGLVTASCDAGHSRDGSLTTASHFERRSKTRLVIEERGLPLAELAAHGAGWQAHVEDLHAHLSGQAAGNWKDRWTELMPRYGDAPTEK